MVMKMKISLNGLSLHQIKLKISQFNQNQMHIHYIKLRKQKHLKKMKFLFTLD